MCQCGLFFFLIFGAFLVSDGEKNDREPYSEDGLPKLFDIDNYNDCVRNHGTFCKVNIVIQTRDNSSNLATIIKRNKHFNNRFNRQFLHRLICFTNESFGDETRMKEHALNVVNLELQNLSSFSSNAIELSVRDYHCSGSYPFEWVDYILWTIIPLYFFLVYKSTVYDLNKRKNAAYPTSKYEKLYNIFAVLKNWEKVMKENKSQDFEKLKCIQSMRFFLTTMMIINHSKLSYGPLFFANPVDFEKVCSNSIFYTQTIFDMLFIIQSYLMISSFLMTNQVLEVRRKHGYFSLYHLFILYLNRVWRFFPSVLVMVLITMYGGKLITTGPHVNEFIYAIQTTCRNSWWTPLLQLAFLKNFEDMCVPGSWYMSVDTLYYVTGMLILYLHLNYNLNLKATLAMVFGLLSSLYAIKIFINDYPVMFKVNVDVFMNLYNSPEFNHLYVSPFSSYSTMCVGIWFGALYFHTKNKEHSTNTIKKFLWIVFMVVSLPILVCLSDYEYEGKVRALIAPLVKPVFACWGALVIIGLSRRQGGIFNKVFEWNFAVKMGNFTFSMYIFHFFLVFQRGAFETELFDFRVFNMIVVILINLVASYALGIFCCVILEQPFATLQKMYLPQIKDPIDSNMDVSCAKKRNNKNK